MSDPRKPNSEIERSVGNDRIVAYQRPMDTVGRLERKKAAFCQESAQRLVAGLGRTVRAKVFERCEVVNPHTVPHDVVLLRTVELEQAENRFRPPDSVPAFRIAIDCLVAIRDQSAVNHIKL